MTEFHNVSFPLPLAFGASGGPSRITNITQLASGAEHRNTSHAQSRHKYNVGAGVKTLDELHDLISFFESRFGKLFGFRFRDPLDFKSCKPNEIVSAMDQIIGSGDGGEKIFHLAKTYSDDAGHYERLITKPVLDSVKIAINGIELSPSNFDINDLTGAVSFDMAPAVESTITAGFEFDVPVRFDTDEIAIALEAFGAGQAVYIPLIELLDHA